jgi:Uma2 family endonuclease
MTVEEFWAFGNQPENESRHLDLVAGRVLSWPPPYKKHGVVCARIGGLLSEFVEHSAIGYTVAGNAGLILSREPDTVVGPDIAIYPLTRTRDHGLTGWSIDLPILAVEVLSANDDVSQMPLKIDEYLRAGVKMVWLADPELKTISVYRGKHNLVVLKLADDLVGGEELPGFSCKVADIFRLPGDPPPSLTPPAT